MTSSDATLREKLFEITVGQPIPQVPAHRQQDHLGRETETNEPDRAPALANVIEELVPAAWHNTGQYQNNRVECDHGRLKARLRPMRGLKTHRTASVVIRGHAFIQNLRRGHYELAVDATPVFRLATAFDELRPAI